MKKLLVLGFFMFTIFTSTMIHNTSHAKDDLTDLQKANIIFNWLEPQFPSLLSPSPQSTIKLDSIYYRYYSNTNVFLATLMDHLWFVDQNGTVHDLGEVDFWVDYIGDEDDQDPNLIGFGPVRIGETWVEHRKWDPSYVGMCHTFVSHSEVQFQFRDMNTSVPISYDFNGKRANYENREYYRNDQGIWFRTEEDGTGQRGDQMAVFLGQTDSNQIDVHRVWYHADGRIDDENQPVKYERYWKRMDCPHPSVPTRVRHQPFE